MNNLNEFIERPDEELKTTEVIDIPPGDFFNSAGNTRIEPEDVIEETKQSNDGDPKDPTDPASQTEKPKGKVVLGKVISGKATVAIINMFIPSFIVFTLGRFKYKADKKQLRLNPEERGVLEPVVQDCLDYITIDFNNPFYALALVAGMIYGAKLFDVIPDLKKMKEEVTNDIDEENDEENEDAIFLLRKTIETTKSRKEKVTLILSEIEKHEPKDVAEAYKIYNAIYPERSEAYFKDWLTKNYEALPISLKFDANDGLNFD